MLEFADTFVVVPCFSWLGLLSPPLPVLPSQGRRHSWKTLAVRHHSSTPQMLWRVFGTVWKSREPHAVLFRGVPVCHTARLQLPITACQGAKELEKDSDPQEHLLAGCFGSRRALRKPVACPQTGVRSSCCNPYVHRSVDRKPGRERRELLERCALAGCSLLNSREHMAGGVPCVQ